MENLCHNNHKRLRKLMHGIFFLSGFHNYFRGGIVTIATILLVKPLFKDNLFISIKNSFCHTICFKCPSISQIVINFTLNIRGWGALAPNIISF